MRFDFSKDVSPNYEPNSFGGPKECPAFAEPALKLEGDADRYNHRAGNDDYTQPGDLFRLLKADEQQRLVENIARHMTGVPREIQLRAICHFFRADPAYGLGVARALKLDISEYVAKAGMAPAAGDHSRT
jgi:catalase